jgi:long-chain acyl-CoA synthetase
LIDSHYSYLNIASSFWEGGVRIGYCSPQTLTDNSPAHPRGQAGDLKLLHPTVLITVPLILDRIIKEIYLRLSSRSPILPPIFTYLMEYKIRWTKRGFDTPLINRLVCKRVREQFGGNLEFVISGGAPLNPRTEELIGAALNVKLMQGTDFTYDTNVKGELYNITNIVCSE